MKVIYIYKDTLSTMSGCDFFHPFIVSVSVSVCVCVFPVVSAYISGTICQIWWNLAKCWMLGPIDWNKFHEKLIEWRIFSLFFLMGENSVAKENDHVVPDCDISDSDLVIYYNSMSRKLDCLAFFYLKFD